MEKSKLSGNYNFIGAFKKFPMVARVNDICTINGESYIMTKSEGWVRFIPDNYELPDKYKSDFKYIRGYNDAKNEYLNAINNIKEAIAAYSDALDKAISEDREKIEGMRLAYSDTLELIDKYTGDIK